MQTLLRSPFARIGCGSRVIRLGASHTVSFHNSHITRTLTVTASSFGPIHGHPSSLPIRYGSRGIHTTPPTFSVTNNNDKTKSDDVPSNRTVLYQRDEHRWLVPQSIIIISTFQVVYWSWYILDFIPMIQSAKDAEALKHAALHTSSTATTTTLTPLGVELSSKLMFLEGATSESIAYLGLGIGGLMLAGSLIYPRYLLHTISLDRSTGGTWISTHSSPYVRARTSGEAVYCPPGGLGVADGNDRVAILKDGWSKVGSHIGLKEGEGSDGAKGLLHLLLAPKEGEMKHAPVLTSLLLENSSKGGRRTIGAELFGDLAPQNTKQAKKKSRTKDVTNLRSVKNRRLFRKRK